MRSAVAYHGMKTESNLGLDAAWHGYILTPERYVGAEKIEDDGEQFEEKMARLTGKLKGSSRGRDNWKRR